MEIDYKKVSEILAAQRDELVVLNARAQVDIVYLREYIKQLETIEPTINED